MPVMVFIADAPIAAVKAFKDIALWVAHFRGFFIIQEGSRKRHRN
jgi:hypothetical protein